MFSTERFAHFVFANADDTYYLDNLLALDLNGYLWYTLKKQDYENVFFFSSTGTGCAVETLDSGSGSCFAQRKAVRRKWAFFHGGADAPAEGRQSILENDADGLCEWVTNCLLQNKRRAFVFRLETLSRLFGQPQQRRNLERLIDFGRQSGRKSILVVCASGCDDALAEELLGDDSIFAVRSGGHCLSDELYTLRRIPEEPLFQAMENHLGDSQLQLWVPDRERLRTLLVRRAVETGQWPESTAILDRQAAFLTVWCGSEAVQREADLGWVPGPNPRYRALWEKLCTDSFYAALCRRAEQELPVRTDAPLALRGDRICSMVASLRLPESFVCWTAPEREVEGQFQTFCRRATTLWSKPVNRQAAAHMENQLYSFQKAVQSEDWATLERVLNILFFCAEHICAETARSREIDELCRLYEECVIDLSFAHTRYQRNYERITQELETARGSVRTTKEAQQSIYLVQSTTAQGAIRETESNLGFIMRDFDLHPVDLASLGRKISQIADRVTGQHRNTLRQMVAFSHAEPEEDEQLPTLSEESTDHAPEEEAREGSLKRGEQEALRRLWQ